MEIKARILLSEKFVIDGKNFVKIQGFINGLGIFKQTVREEIVPDAIEGKEVLLNYNIGLDNACKPYLRLNGITLK